MATRERNLEAFLVIQHSVQQAASDLNDAERAVQKATRHVEETKIQLDLALAGMKRLVEVLNLGTPLTVDRFKAATTAGVSKKTRKGTRVRFVGSRVGYTHAPKPNEEGTVTTMPGYGSRVWGSTPRTYLPGPGGGLLYVTWDESGTLGISPNDLEAASDK
jgi:hypothetical protein